MPTIVHAKKPKPRKPGDPPIRRMPSPNPTAPANDDGESGIKVASADFDREPTRTASALVTARKPGKRYTTEPEMTPEEHKRRGDAADALFREMKRRIAEKLRS